MKTLLCALLLALPAGAWAETIVLKDGTRFEGKIEGEMEDMVLVKTQYGTLNVKKSDILQDMPQTIATSTTAAQPTTAPELPKTFKTLVTSTMSFDRVYFEGDVAVATETMDSKGELLSLEGFIKDGNYKEFYPDGSIKTEKTIVNAKATGVMKAYYQNGALQSETVYLDGALNGAVKIYSEKAKLIFEQNFKNGVPNGYFKEFDDTGALKSETFYVDGHVAEKPKTAEAKTTTPESMVTTKIQSLARGERFSFYLNGKYIGKTHLDKDFNIISKDGKVPDGTVKVYNKEGKLKKEFIFLKNEITLLRAYNEAGDLTGEYTFTNLRAIKK